jgi:hypothetical protein
VFESSGFAFVVGQKLYIVTASLCGGWSFDAVLRETMQWAIPRRVLQTLVPDHSIGKCGKQPEFINKLIRKGHVAIQSSNVEQGEGLVLS